MRGRRLDRGRQAWRAVVREVGGRYLLLDEPIATFLLLSLLDLLVTYALLRQGVDFYEANPVARWWFARWNIAGMTIFKFLLVGLIATLCELVERQRPGRGRGVLRIACLTTAAVVAYGVWLLLRHVSPAFV